MSTGASLGVCTLPVVVEKIRFQMLPRVCVIYTIVYDNSPNKLIWRKLVD